MSLTLYGQIDAAWKNEILGNGPDTIGSAGCYVTSDADVITWIAQGASGTPVGLAYNPSQLNQLYKAKGIYVSSDLLPDTALHVAFPDIVEMISVNSYTGPADLTKCDNTGPDYILLYILWPNGLARDNPHFLPVWSYRAGAAPGTLMVADSWDGTIKPLSHYGDPATIIVKIIHLRAILPTPPPPPPPPDPYALTGPLMYDSVNASVIPTTALMVAGYADGANSKWSDADWARFPTAQKLRITVMGNLADGDILDVETGDATPDYVPGWVVARRKAGVDPIVYCNRTNWPQAQGFLVTAGVPEPWWWITTLDGTVVTGPRVVACQNQNATANGANFDSSVTAAKWPVLPPVPPPSLTIYSLKGDDGWTETVQDIDALIALTKAKADADAHAKTKVGITVMVSDSHGKVVYTAYVPPGPPPPPPDIWPWLAAFIAFIKKLFGG